MVSISQVKSCASLLSKGGGRIVYSTARNPESVSTMFDAFCKTMQQSGNIKRMQKRVTPVIQEQAAKVAAEGQRILMQSGADATISVRVKGADSTRKKMQKAINEIYEEGYDKARARVLDLTHYEGPISLVNDGFGIRYTLGSEFTNGHRNADLLFNTIKRRNNTPSAKVAITELEDYCGKGITPYAGKNIVDDFMTLQYVTPGGRHGNTASLIKIKKFGYTRSNINSYIHGIPTEIQIGGKYTNKWGDVEHVLYDKRQGKLLNLDEFKTDAQKELAKKIVSAYEDVLKNPKLSKEYSDNYLNKIWDVLREAEEKGLAVPNYPPLPAGIPEILSAENIMKLAHS